MENSAGRRLNEEQKAAAVKRLYEDEIRMKQERHDTLVKKVYREEAPKTISSTQLQESISRQHDAEMQRRSQRKNELKNKYYATAAPHRMPADEIEGSIQRIYGDAMRHKDENIRKLEARYDPLYSGKESNSITCGALMPVYFSNFAGCVSRTHIHLSSFCNTKLHHLNFFRYQFKRKDGAKIGSGVLSASSSRLSQPKKSVYTDDEINKIYGF